MKKIILLLSLLTVTLLTACRSNANSEEPTQAEAGDAPIQIDFWHAMAGPHEAAINHLIERFHEQYPHIRINAAFQGGYVDLDTQFQAATLAGNLPHIGQQTTDFITNYVDAGILLPLNNFYDNLDPGTKDDIVDVFLSNTNWNGTFYSVPFGKSTRVLYVNTDALDAAGFAIPTTWEEIIEIAEALREPENFVFGMGFENSWAAEFVALTMQMGGMYIDEQTATAHVSSDAGISAAEYIMGLYRADLARFAGEDNFLSGIFGNQQVLMYIGTSSSFPHVTAAVDGNFNWTTAPLPLYNGQAASRFSGNDLFLFDNGMTAEVQEAAETFLAFILSPEENAQWAVDSGFIPVRYAALEHPIWQDYIETTPHAAAGAEQFASGFVTARVLGATEAWRILAEELDEIRLEISDIETALTRADERINAVISTLE